MTIYTVINFRTGQVLLVTTDAKKARARRERADRSYGACTATIKLS